MNKVKHTALQILAWTSSTVAVAADEAENVLDIPISSPGQSSPVRETRQSAPRLAPKMTVAVPSVRRVGGLSVQHNVEVFRDAQAEQSGSLQGFVAEPLVGDQVGVRLSVLLEQSATVSGRFWYLQPLSTADLEQDLSARLRAQKRYQVDSWARFSVNFEPDHTEIRGSLHSTDLKHVLVSESLFAPALASEEDIAAAFLKIWARFGRSLGHMASVTWQSSNLVSLDLGHPLLSVGDELVVGRNFVARSHPVTGEILEVRQEELAEIRVLETESASSLAQITRARQSSLNLALQGLQVWKRSSSRSLVSPTELGKEVTRGAAPRGFAFQAPPEEQTPPTHIPPVGHELTDQEPASAGSVSPKPSVQPSPQAPSPPTAGPAGTGEEPLAPSPFASDESSPAQGDDLVEALLAPETWKMRNAFIGVGQSWGTFDTSPCPNSPCDRFSGFPGTGLNLLAGGVDFSLTPEASLEILAEANVFSGNDVKGYEWTSKSLLMNHASSIGRDRLSILAGPEVSFGSVETVLTRQGLFHAALLGGVHYGFASPGIGLFAGVFELSVVDLITGSFVFETSFRGERFYGLPAELGAFVGYRRAASYWSEITLGVTWNLSGLLASH